MNEEDEAFEQLSLKQGSWEHTSGWRKKQIMDTQAFPNPHRTDMTGMTLRDYFAAQAMQSLTRRLFAYEVLESKHYAEDVSKAAFQMADAMLKAREA